MSLFPKVAKNTIVQILGRAGVIFTTIITTALLTRLLGTTGYGNYIFVISVLMFFVTISDWGTSMIFVREASKIESSQSPLFGGALVIRLVSSLVCLVFITLIATIFPLFRPLFIPIEIIGLVLILISLKTSLSVVFQTKLRFEFMAMVDVLISILFLIFLLLVFLFARQLINLSTILMLYFFSNLVGIGLSFFWARELANFTYHLDPDLTRKILRESLPTGALLILFSVYNRLDIIILQGMKGPEAVGIYGLAYKVHDNLILGAAYLTGALFPVIAKISVDHTKENPILKEIYRKTFDILFIAAVGILLTVIILAPLIISIIGGPDFSNSVIALRILVFATFIAYFNHLTGYTLIALGKQKVSLSIAIMALFFNLGANILLIPNFSYLAAAFNTIATEGLVFVLTSLYLAKKFDLRPSITFPKTLIEIFKTKGKIF
ncbi:hypothetical protein COY91_03450 [Candidatus Shapirobacteria bacterium CG_4_10_14_0_8_um_filter_39_15]|nr:MAG: hypothetical protein COY91_03450 [Candidatus Shapirobacteria bacterium CG_4_10_14_0_8_um_filter_39_15]